MWTEAVEEKRREGDKMNRALNFLKRSSITSAWNAWRSVAQHRAEQKSKVAQSLGTIMHRDMAAAWRLWTAYIYQRQNNRKVRGN